ncbi:MurR/RpiR family transcriptional regulator [Texcoconibacillus texcoconensis]|uniref:DNA-binding MurR/RpiR family transcriptional regulator n=1 Tax=Texcoconibacillus texcoconensis TaxID=1095777 RepID=A0A840QR55_9BACI|nr:MurR/RpiR family transcriptional regulator [Texcoconibacillus texcoconensis]MBB5173845.1 DNA-binding MurR/RpiR family transcriptional regulator [Texcoconibacillus texcoconensis]
MENIEAAHVKHRIKAAYTGFREKEKVIADYILEHPEDIVHSTISQVAENIQVAEATVFRFCKKIGFKGYQAMKIALASEVDKGFQDIHETIQEGDDERQVTEKVFKANIRTLEETLSVLNQDTMKEATKAILEADRVEFYGSGGSGVIAVDAHHKFIRTGIATASYSDSHFQVMSASQLTENDVAALISHTGANRDMLDVLDVAQEHNVTTIGITTLAKSPLSEGVDIPLFTVSEETDYRSEALSSRLAQLSIIDALYVNISIARKEQMEQSLNNMRNAVSIKRI